MAALYTIGHGARRAAELISILREAAIDTLVDVRAFPASKRNPQFAREPLSASLRDAGIGYDWQGRALGGYRKLPYLEHMKTALFRDAAAAVAERAGCVRLMCAESAREHLLHPQEELWRDD